MSKNHGKNPIKQQVPSTVDRSEELSMLRSENLALKEEVAALKAVADGELSLTVERLYEENYLLTEKLKAVEGRLESYLESEKKSAERLNKADRRADELNSLATYKYLLELKTVKLLCEKLKTAYHEELSAEKMRITDLLTDFLKDVDTKNSLMEVREAAEGASGILRPDPAVSKEAADFYGEDVFFDLDAVQNPKGDLDLRALCEELGIFGGSK